MMLALILGTLAGAPTATPPVDSVALCDIAKDPGRYAAHAVEFRAVSAAAHLGPRDVMVVSDPYCATGATFVIAEPVDPAVLAERTAFKAPARVTRAFRIWADFQGELVRDSATGAYLFRLASLTSLQAVEISQPEMQQMHRADQKAMSGS